LRIRYSTEKNGRPVKKAIVYTQDEHGIALSKVDTDAVMIIKRLRANGFETYIVGGAVRDLILGQAPKDFDIVSAASPAHIRKLFRNARVIGHRFRLVHVALGKKLFEVSTFRSLKDGLTSNTYGTIEEDVQRRDFSMNALFYDPIEQLVIDYVDGMKDIWKKQIRPIIPLATIFTDDPVRMIRAVKYSVTTGFHIPFQVQWKIRRQVSLLSSISSSRLTEEIFKIIHSPHAARIIENLDALGIYAYLQPNAATRMQNHEFRTQYLQRFAAKKNCMEAALAALVATFLENDNSTLWDEAHFKEVCLAARSFILPMNPPRALLDRAVRLLFKEHNVIVKRAPWFASKPYKRERPVNPDTNA
jgi:poly(A) polymerase